MPGIIVNNRNVNHLCFPKMLGFVTLKILAVAYRVYNVSLYDLLGLQRNQMDFK